MKNFKSPLVFVQKYKYVLTFVFVLLLLNTLLYSRIIKQCYYKYSLKRNHTSEQILILKWDKYWTEDSSLEVRASPDNRCLWTNDRCALPVAHVVEFDFFDLDASDLPWKFYRYVLN